MAKCSLHYHLTNLQNQITTKIFDIVRMITLQQQNFSQSDPVLIRQFSRNCSSNQSWSGQNWFQSWSSPNACSSLVQSDKAFSSTNVWYDQLSSYVCTCSRCIESMPLGQMQLVNCYFRPPPWCETNVLFHCMTAKGMCYACETIACHCSIPIHRSLTTSSHKDNCHTS